MIRRFGLVMLLAIALAVMAACGRDAEPGVTGTSGSSPQPESFPAQIQGFVYQVNPVFLVADPHDAPPGSAPRMNALVVARDPLGKVVGASMTNRAGEFMLAGVPQGLITLEAHVDPASTQPNTTAQMTAVMGMEMRPGQNFVVSRDKAIESVRPEFPPSALVAATLNPIPAGAELTAGSDEGYAGQAPRLRLQRPAWLFFVNPLPRTAYRHPVEYLLVDAQSGEVERLAGDFYPLVNGAPLWSTDSELFDFRTIQGIEDLDQIPADFRLEPLAEVVQVPPGLRFRSLAPERAIRPRLNTDPESVFAVLHSGGRELAFDLEVFLFRAWLQSQGVPSANIRVVVSQEKPRQIVLTELRRAIELTKAAMIARGNQNPPLFSTMIYYHTAHGGPELIRLNDGIRTAEAPESIPLRTTPLEVVGGNLERAAGLFTLVGNPACRVRYIFDACQSGPFISTMTEFLDSNPGIFPHNVIAFSATDGDNFTGYMNSYTGQFVKQAKIVKADIDGVFVRAPGRPGAVLDPLAFIRTNGDGLPQNPQVRFHEGRPDEICPDPLPPVSPPRPPAELPKPMIEVVNQTGVPMSMIMSDLLMVVEVGKGVQQELDKPAQGMDMQSVELGPIKIPRLDLNLDVPDGVLQSMVWVEKEGIRTLIVAPAKARPEVSSVSPTE